MTIHALVPQCALSVLSCSEFKIAKIFWNSPLDPTGECLQHPPDFPATQWCFSSLCLSKNQQPQKIAGYGTEKGNKWPKMIVIYGMHV